MRKFHFLIICSCALFHSCNTSDTNDLSFEQTADSTETELLEEEVTEEWTEPTWDLASIQFQSEYEECLPAVNPEFQDWINSDSLWQHFPYSYDPVFAYISTHIDSTSTRIVTETDSIWGDLGWQQYFSGGILYEELQYAESGVDAALKTNCSDLDFVISILFPLIEDEENSWNEDSTSYGPDGAGCYYEFSRDSIQQTIDVNWYCGC